MTENIWLQRPSGDVPWGFRLTGGDYQKPLTVQRVTPGSIAATGLSTNDVILRIGESDTSHLTYGEAMEVIKNSGNLLQLCISKSGGGHNSPSRGGGMYKPQTPTRLDEQLAGLKMNDSGPSSPFASHTSPPPGAPSFNGQKAPSSSVNYPGYQPSEPHYNNTQSPTQFTPSYTSQSPVSFSPSSYKPQSPDHFSPQRPEPKAAAVTQSPPAMPDAVLNMAARGPPEKKPWAYAPDMSSIQQQREKVRKKMPVSTLPKYMHALNLPNFSDDKPLMLRKGQGTPGTPGTPTTPPVVYPQGPGEATVQHVQYNSPLDLYSSNSVQEAFEGQTEGVITGVGGLGKKESHDVKESPTYKLIHGLDEPKARPHITPSSEALRHQQRREPAPEDETRFSGVHHAPSDIPSKSFHRLQMMTGGPAAEIDTTSIRPPTEEEGYEVGGYDEASIRYMGKNIPSKSFRLLQGMTGGDSLDVPTHGTGPRRQRKKPPPPESPEQNPDDIVDIRFVGGNIPSRSFKMLQKSIPGDPAPLGGNPVQNTATASSGGDAPGSRTVKVIKLRSSSQPTQQSDQGGVTDF